MATKIIKTTKYEIREQQDGDNEEKSLGVVWAPTVEGQQCRITMRVYAPLDGAPPTTNLWRETKHIATFVSDSITTQDVTIYGPEYGTFAPPPGWYLLLQPEVLDLSKLHLATGYDNSGPYTVNWEVDIEIEEVE